jgi:hypothetical protein
MAIEKMADPVWVLGPQIIRNSLWKKLTKQ